MNTNDPIDILIYLVVDEKENLGDKYKKIIDIIKRLRLIVGGNTSYIKKEKTTWKSIDYLWHQLKKTGNTKKEIYKKIANVLDISPHTVKRIIFEIEKENKKIKSQINEKTLFDYLENKHD